MKNTYKNIVIINTVPINGGDEALLRATTLGLNNYFDKPNISVLCNNPNLSRKAIDFVPLDWDWEYAFKKVGNNESKSLFQIKLNIRKILNKFFKVTYNHSLSRMFSSKREKRIYKILENADVIVLGAGGYIHDYYGYKNRLKTLDFIHSKLNKPYYIFAQSIGPFWKKENYASLKYAFENARKIILREHNSMKYLQDIGYHCENVIVTNDVAFYLNKGYAKKVNLKKKLNKIVLNFRDWNFEEESKFNLLKAKVLCERLIEKGYDLTFLSTCQGVSGYLDDSIFADKIVDLLSKEQRVHCTVLKEKYTLEQLIIHLSENDAYIGMRLHGAILSLITGIPALNIAYEDKTIGIYNLLGINEYCFSYKEKQEIWNDKVDNFISDYVVYLNKVERIRSNAAIAAEENFKLLM